MKYFIIKNNILPFGKYHAISIFPFIFYKGENISKKIINHEKIHLKQQIELGIIPFYILYIIFHIIYGYRNNPFEKEAYNNENNYNYLNNRKFFGRK